LEADTVIAILLGLLLVANPVGNNRGDTCVREIHLLDASLIPL